MKINILFASVATAGLFTTGALAQEGVLAAPKVGASTTSTTTKTTSASVESPAPGPITSGTDIGVSARDGITVSGASVMITRNGVIEKLTSEIKLENGTRVLPDGTIITPESGRITLRPSQVLTFTGKIMDAPVDGSKATATAPSPTAPATGAPATTTVIVNPATPAAPAAQTAPVTPLAPATPAAPAGAAPVPSTSATPAAPSADVTTTTTTVGVRATSPDAAAQAAAEAQRRTRSAEGAGNPKQ